jgi:hypothetical protein
MRIKVKVALGSTLAGISGLVTAVEQGFAYNEQTDPGALNGMVSIGIASVAFLLVPAAMIAWWFIGQVRREVARMGLTPAQAALGQAVLMTGAAYEWHEYNRQVSDRLTASVMGPERGAEGPWG